jgi:hypothetical protein
MLVYIFGYTTAGEASIETDLRHFVTGRLFECDCTMKTFIAIVLWFLLLVLCWPLALVLLIVFPLVWLILLPFRIVGLTIGVVFKLIEAILLFPFRLLGKN